MNTLLKSIDLFHQPVHTFITSREKKNKTKKFSDSHGSVFGGILSIICVISTYTYLHFEIGNMYSGTNDFYGSRIITNTFEEGLNLEFMKNSSFYPSFQIRAIKDENFDIDIFNGNPSKFNISFEKLSKFIKIQMTIKYKLNGESTYENIPFRKCKPIKFSSGTL